MPKEKFGSDHQFLERSALLSFEEITRIAKIFIAHGVEKIRLTGGEPLLRKNIEKLIEMLAVLTSVDGKPLDLTMTTNASLLGKKAQSLKDAGLKRVTVSLDWNSDPKTVDFTATGGVVLKAFIKGGNGYNEYN